MQAKDKVFVLKKVKYGEADLIVQCLNSKGERVNFIARSALKSKKRFGGGVLEPTHYIHVSYEQKKQSYEESPLYTLQEAHVIEDFQKIRIDYDRLQVALHFVQVIGAVAKEGAIHSQELFNLLGNSLRAAETSENLEALRLHFEVKLLASMGVLHIENLEQVLLHIPIAQHAAMPLDQQEKSRVRGKLKMAFQEILPHFSQA